MTYTCVLQPSTLSIIPPTRHCYTLYSQCGYNISVHRRYISVFNDTPIFIHKLKNMNVNIKVWFLLKSTVILPRLFYDWTFWDAYSSHPVSISTIEYAIILSARHTQLVSILLCLQNTKCLRTSEIYPLKAMKAIRVEWVN